MCIDIYVGPISSERYSYYIETGNIIEEKNIIQGLRPYIKKDGNKNIYTSFNVIIGDEVEQIGNKAFSVEKNKLCMGLKSVRLGKKTCMIGEKAFFGCENLSLIQILAEVSEIGKGAFCGCRSLKRLGRRKDRKSLIELPNAIKRISANLFKNCSALTNVIVPENVTVIERGAFSGCEKLSSLGDNVSILKKGNAIIPERIEEIGSRAFEGCISLCRVIIPEKVKDIRWRTFSNCAELKEAKIPSQVKAIWSGAFKGCFKLDLYRTAMPNDVDEIAYDAFEPQIGLFAKSQENLLKNIALLPNEGLTVDDHTDLSKEEVIANVFGINSNMVKDVISFFVPRKGESVNSVYPNRGWINTIYRWPDDRTAKNERETVFEFNGYSRWLNDQLKRRKVGRSSCMDCIESILEWGNVAQHADMLVPNFYRSLIEIKPENNGEYSLIEILKLGRRNWSQHNSGNNEQPQESRDRISTWSKVIAAYLPGTCFIYDSRVALALSYISLCLAGDQNGNHVNCFWTIPEAQSELQDRSFQEFLPMGSVQNAIGKNREKYIEYLKKEQENQNEDKDDSLITKITKGFDIPTCYCRYICLLNALADIDEIKTSYAQLPDGIQNAYESVFAFIKEEKIRKHKAIMSHLEKVLFMMKEIILKPQPKKKKSKASE